MKAGEKLWNGAIVTPHLAAAYNSLQERIESFSAAGLPVPEQLLNGAHNLLNFDAVIPRHQKREAAMKLPTLSDGTGRELIYPGACLNRSQAVRYGDQHMPKDLRAAGFKTHVFESDPQIHGAHYYRITYGKEC